MNETTGYKMLCAVWFDPVNAHRKKQPENTLPSDFKTDNIIKFANIRPEFWVRGFASPS